MLEGFKPISITSGVPTLSITKNGIGFNKAAILKIDAPQYVKVLHNTEKNMIALCPCDKDDDYAAPFAKDGLKTINVRWNSKDFTSTIALMMKWDGSRMNTNKYNVKSLILSELTIKSYIYSNFTFH